MTENLTQLKMILPILAAAAAVSVFALWQLLIPVFLGKVSKKVRKNPSEVDNYAEKDDSLKYERIIRKETLVYTWMTNAAGLLCLGLLIAAALFREKIIEKTGMELFVSLILILSVSASYCIFQDKRWKANAVENLFIYICFFAGMVRDLHQGIRIMLFESDTDFPLKSLLMEIQRNNPGISGIELVKTAGRVLQSPELMNIYENNGSDILEKKRAQNTIRKMDMFNTVCVLLSFAIILALCFML